MRHGRAHVADRVGQVQRAAFHPAAPGEHQQLAGQLRRPLARAANTGQRPFGRRIAGQAAAENLGIALDDGQQIVEIVRHPSGQPAQSLDADGLFDGHGVTPAALAIAQKQQDETAGQDRADQEGGHQQGFKLVQRRLQQGGGDPDMHRPAGGRRHGIGRQGLDVLQGQAGIEPVAPTGARPHGAGAGLAAQIGGFHVRSGSDMAFAIDDGDDPLRRRFQSADQLVNAQGQLNHGDHGGDLAVADHRRADRQPVMAQAAGRDRADLRLAGGQDAPETGRLDHGSAHGIVGVENPAARPVHQENGSPVGVARPLALRQQAKGGQVLEIVQARRRGQTLSIVHIRAQLLVDALSQGVGIGDGLGRQLRPLGLHSDIGAYRREQGEGNKRRHHGQDGRSHKAGGFETNQGCRLKQSPV